MHAGLRLRMLCPRAAWNVLGDLSPAEAKRQYIALLSSLRPDWDARGASKGGSGPGGAVFSSLSHAEEEHRGISVSILKIVALLL